MRIPRYSLPLALCLAAPLAWSQSGPLTDAPLGHPRPLDTSNTRIQAQEGRDAMVTPLKISYGRKSQQWTAAKLAPLPHESIQVTDAKTNATETYSGVPLMAFLVELGVPQEPKEKDLRLYVVAESSDGDKAVYSLAEIAPAVHDGSVLLADSVNGKPLGDAGPIELICSGEKWPARWIRNVVSIKVAKAD